ncbi:MAG: DUF1583 domain-containing protein [Planctomycetaceae bacterium]|nr:DUF1583 domain-containing protein [Planctomycetaceae bacterium]
MAVTVAVFCSIPQQAAVAQLDFLKSLLGGRQQPQSRFTGYQKLADATQQAQQGDVAKSLQSVREAFKEGGAKEPLNDPEAASIAQSLMSLSKLWTEKNAPANEVADVLREVVLPSKPAGEVFPYPMQWQLSYDAILLTRPNVRLPAPESVSAELVRWTLLAKQTDALRERLKAGLASPKRGWLARIIAVQLAVAEHDVRAANALLKTLAEDTLKAGDTSALELMCHAVMAAARDDLANAAGLRLLEAVLDRADATLTPDNGLKGNSPWLRLHMARWNLLAGRKDDAVRLAKSSVEKPFNDQRYGAEYSLYLRRLQAQQAAAVLLEGGFVAEALEILGPISEEPEPRSVVYYDRPNIGAMLGRELQKLPAQARFELLRKWVIPRSERTALREVCDFVPFDVPRGAEHDPLPRAGLLRDVYSTDWHLLTTAKELGKLDEVMQDLAGVSQQTPQVEALRTLGAVLRDGSGPTEPQGASRGSSGSSSNAPAASAVRLTETTARLQKLLEATTQNLPKWSDNNKAPFPMLTFVVTSEAARHREWRDVTRTLLEKLIEHTQIIQWDRPRAHVRMTWLELMRMRGVGNSQTPSLSEWPKLQPKHWVEAGIQTGSQHASGSLPGVWYALDGYIQHVTGPYDSDLSFEFPLAGKFELSFDCREGAWSEANVGYGGAQASINAYSDAVFLMGKGRSGYDNGPNMANLLHKTPWNRYTIQVDGDVVRYLANGQFVHEDKPGTSAPWLTLGADWGRTPIFRNFKFTGTPVIPREIPLLTNARLRGWVASHFEESRSDALREPRRYVQQIVEQDGQKYATLVEADETNADQAIVSDEPETDWKFQNGELTSSRREAFWPGAAESWLYYQRPLRDGDSLRYEFFHQSGLTEAAPTIGRVAYLFGADGITRHWITDGTSDVFATRADNGVLEKRKLALKEGDWNSVEVTLSGEELRISLNGEVAVTERMTQTPLGLSRWPAGFRTTEHVEKSSSAESSEPPGQARWGVQFGVYHDAARTSLRVRKAVLTGNWPRELNDKLRSAIEWPEPIEELPNSRLFSYAFGEDRISDNAYEIYRRALTLDAKTRYEFLRRWVMPNAHHDLLRMAGAFTPTHPAPPVLKDHPIDVATTDARQAVDQRLVQTGGNFVCPAILLVLAAVETDRLEELKQEILKHPPTSSLEMGRNRSAILGIIALIQDRPEEAVEALWECSRLISDKDAQPQYARWGDVALASLAIQHPVTQEAAYELLDRIQRKQLQTGHPGNSDYGRFVRQLHGQVHYLMHGGPSEEFGTQPRTKQWRMVPQPSAKSRGEGYPIASFDTLTGEMAIRGGHDCDMAYFQSPLRGNYEVSCRLSHLGYRETILMAGGIASAMRYTHTESRVMHVRTKITEVPSPEPISPRASNGFDYKIVVRVGRFTSYVDGKRLHEADLPEQPDPWLAVLGLAGHSSRYARNIVITGKPEIPSELDLLAAGDLKGWMTDYYGNALSQSPFVWTAQDGVLMSHQTPIRNEVPGRLKVENVIRYHRPMLEDGEISYEFFYDPETKLTVDDPSRREFVNGVIRNAQRTVKGQTLAHPALDRMVCLLEPDGVKIHWLTDGRFDRTGLLPGNAEVAGALRDPAAAARSDAATKMPLKDRDWNAVKFAVKGDTLTIELNDEPVFSHAIEPTNLRHFGLFHYANESSVRVRNIRYRGDWPKTLPPVDQQELATGPERLAVTPDSELPDTATFDFTGSKFETADFAYHWDAKAAAMHIRPTPAGLRFELPAGETKSQWVGVHPKLKLSGDFRVTIEYEGLKTTPAKESWGTGLSFKLKVDQSYETGFEAREQAGSKGTRAAWLITSPLKEYLYKDESLPGFAESGRMRLQRRGPVIYYFITEKGSNDFRLLAQRPIGTNDINAINIQADASDQAGGAEFVLKSLSIRAAKITKLK